MQNNKELQEKLEQAYDRMLGRARETLEHARNETLPNLHHVVEQAKETAIELGELTRDEAEKIRDYLMRDITDAAQDMESERKNLADWFRFDMQLIEDQLIEMFSHMVDHTRLELTRLKQQAMAADWHTGEITGPGSLQCRKCRQQLDFHKTGHIPPCPKCKSTVFRRVIEENGE